VAREAFATQDALILEDVARAADVGIGTLYRHFPTREALVEAVYAAELDAVTSSAPGLLTELTPPAVLRALMDRYAAFAAAKRGMVDTLRAGWASGRITTPPPVRGSPPPSSSPPFTMAHCGPTSRPATSPPCWGCSSPRPRTPPRRPPVPCSTSSSTRCAQRRSNMAKAAVPPSHGFSNPRAKRFTSHAADDANPAVTSPRPAAPTLTCDSDVGHTILFVVDGWRGSRLISCGDRRRRVRRACGR